MSIRDCSASMRGDREQDEKQSGYQHCCCRGVFVLVVAFLFLFVVVVVVVVVALVVVVVAVC